MNEKRNFDEQGVHLGELTTYKYIAQWHDVPFPFSKSDGWDRYGILGVLGHMTLQHLNNTHILEIGTGESSLYFSQLCRALHRRFFTCDLAKGKITNPMSVPGYLHEDIVLLEEGKPFKIEDYEKKACVAFAGSSDNFFQQVEFPQIGVSFIDGDHTYLQAKRDFENALKLTVPNGIVFIHDTYPPNEEYTSESCCGDVYRLRQELEMRNDLDVFTFNKLVTCDVGLTMVRKKPEKREYFHE